MTLALPADVPILDGWNVWDVLQSVRPIDPFPGSLNDQLAAWVREAMGVPGLPIALTSSAAAGPVITTRAVIPELAGVPKLGVNGSSIVRRTIAFESSGGPPSIAWPHDDNLILDAVYHPAPAPAEPSPAPVATRAATNGQQEASLLPLGLVLGAVVLIALARKRVG